MLAASATSATMKGRKAAEALMVDTCTIVRKGKPVTDLELGTVTYPAAQTIYSGKCRLKLPIAIARPNIVGGEQKFTQHPVLSLPATGTGVANVQVDDEMTINTSLLMPNLVGHVYRVRAQPGMSHMTAARFEIIEALG